MKKMLIMAGGTGGHVFPALAVAEEMKLKDIEVHWLGTKRGIENDLVPSAGYPLHHIKVTGLVGSGIKRKIMAPFTLLRAVMQAVTIIRKVKPAVVLGMGGFASGPGGVAAWLMRKPIVIHEQNAVAGATNHHLSKLADVVLTGFRDVENLAKESVWVGNPVRAEIAAARPETTNRGEQIMTSNQRNVLVLGGSQGAKNLNEGLPQVFEKLSEKFELSVWHQVGKGNKSAIEQAYASLEGLSEVKVDEFIADMATAYQWPDLIICRAGAMTVTEVMAAGKAAVFLPYPHAAGDHQTINAQFMVDVNASVIGQDEKINTDEFYDEISDLLARPYLIYKMGQAASFMYRNNAAINTAKYCMEAIDA